MKVEVVFEPNEQGNMRVSGVAMVPLEEYLKLKGVPVKFEGRIVGKVIDAELVKDNVLVTTELYDDDIIGLTRKGIEKQLKEGVSFPNENN